MRHVKWIRRLPAVLAGSVIVQVPDEYSGPGRHWTPSTSATDGRISVEQGL
jgi:hypothetical protein